MSDSIYECLRKKAINKLFSEDRDYLLHLFKNHVLGDITQYDFEEQVNRLVTFETNRAERELRLEVLQ